MIYSANSCNLLQRFRFLQEIVTPDLRDHAGVNFTLYKIFGIQTTRKYLEHKKIREKKKKKKLKKEKSGVKPQYNQPNHHL